MLESPLLSVFMPTYNGEKFVRDAVESVLDNGFADFELVVIDDGSTDTTVQILESIRHPALRLIRQAENLGVASTRARGVALLRGQYLALLDQDDIALPGRFEIQIQRLAEHAGPDILGSAVECFGDVEGTHRSPQTDGEIKASLLFNASLVNPSVCMKVAPLREGRIRYSVDAGPVADYALWVDAMRVGLRLENLPAAITRYRRHGSAMTLTLPFHHFGTQNIIVRRRVVEFHFPDMPPAEREALVDALSYRLEGGRRWVDGVCAMSHAVMLARSVAHIDAALMIRLLEGHFVRMLEHAISTDGIDNETLEMMTETNEHFERWRMENGGALDQRIITLIA